MNLDFIVYCCLTILKVKIQAINDGQARVKSLTLGGKYRK